MGRSLASLVERQERRRASRKLRGASIRKSAAATLEPPVATSTVVAAATPDYSNIDPLSLLANQTRRPGRLFLYKKAVMFDGLAASPPSVDIGRMSATFIISTPAPDRSQDVIDPLGISFDDYRLNPVVLWDHGLKDITVPIGTSEDDESGTLAVSVSPQGVTATCFFSKSLYESEQLFGLVEEGIIRAASIHVDPYDFQVRAPQGVFMGRPGLLIKTCGMLEWSLCGVGDNPEAVRKVLDRGTLASRTIAPAILKSLQANAATIPSQGRGWSAAATTLTASSQERTTVAKSITKAADETDDEFKKRCKKAADDGDEEAAKMLKTLAKSNNPDDEPPPDMPGGGNRQLEKDDEHDDASEAAPPGAQVLKATHDNLSELADHLDEAGKMLEHPEVKEHIATLADEMRGHVADVEGLHKEQYPDEPELAKGDSETADDDNPNNTNDQTSGMVKFLARAKTHRLGLRGIGNQLVKMAGSRHLKPAHREDLQRLAKSISRISKATDDAIKAGLSDGTTAADKAFYEEMRKQFSALRQQVEDAIPHRRNQ